MIVAGQTPRVFISYSSKDADFVFWLVESLKGLGHNIWLDRADILGGVQTFDTIQKALDRSEVMLLVMTPDSMTSRFVNSEWTYFFCECDKKLIPILLEPLEPPNKINFMLASLQHIDFHREDHETALSILHQTLHASYTEVERQEGDPNGSVLPRSYGPLAGWGQRSELTAGSAGLVYMHPDFPVDDFSGWLRQARRRIRVLNTWSHVIARHDHLLAQALGRGVALQILLLDPSSTFAKQRSLDLHLDDEEVPQNIRANIRQLATLYPELDGARSSLELRLYNVLPSFSIHCVDDQALIGFFPHAARTTSFPLLEIHIDAPFGQYIDAEFEQIWKSATPVDLAPQFSDRVRAANLALVEPLSERELEILRLVNDGLSNQEIADKLVVTLATVKKHINHLYGKLGVASRARAIRRARDLNLV